MIGAVAFGFISLILLISGWFILQKTRGLEQADQNFKFPFATWMWVALPAVVIFSIVIGGLITFPFHAPLHTDGDSIPQHAH